MSRLSHIRTVLFLLFVAILPLPVAAQTPAVMDPRIVEFDPSPDHNSTLPSGQPFVTRYDLQLHVAGTSQPTRVVGIGKPAPQGDGKIRVDLTSVLSPLPAPGTIYEVRMVAVGAQANGVSLESNTFAFSSLCSASLSPTSVSVGGTATTGSVAVAAVAGCAWTASSSASWITITGGGSGSGNGTVSYSVAANAGASSRTGTLTIAGLTFTLTQAGGCTYNITPSATSVSASAATGSVSVATGASCAWTASSSASWISVTTGAGTGPGSVGYTVAANTSTSQRTGTVTIAGRTFTVTQDAAACTFTLSPVSTTLGPSATTGNVAVAAGSGCAWTASSSVSWITITAGASGNGNGQVSYSVAANPGTGSRSGTITAGGQTFSVTQSGQTCTFAISPVSTSVPADATSSNVSVDTLAGCTWNATSAASWISITSGGSGSGDGTVAFTVAANPNLAARTGTLTIGGETFTVNQAGVTCAATIAPVSANVGSSGATGTVAVTLPAACTWTATSGASWITITSGGSGSGNGSVGYSVAANTSTSSRSANVTIAGRTFSVSQSGITCGYTVAPTTAAATSAAGTGNVTVTSAAGCAWTASSSVSWISVTGGASGSGSGTVSYSFAANPTTHSRVGVMTVAGQPVTVTQAGGCGYSISPASTSRPASAGNGNVNVTAGPACAWSASSTASWVTFSPPATGTGNGSVDYAVAANTDSSSRSATITVAGQPFVITQAGAACDATLNPVNQSIAAAGANSSVNVTVPGGCAWTAVSSVSWITVLTGASGSGNGTVTYRVDPNAAGTIRTGTIAIGGQLLTVTQAAASCLAALSATTESVGAAGGSRVVSVTIPTGCLWTAQSNVAWITVTSGAGPNSTGNAAVTYLVAPNTSTAPRTGTLTISGRTFTVEQEGTCDITISPTSVSADADAADGSVTVTTGASCSWSASSSASWLSVTGGASGVGNGTVLYSTTANTSNVARTGTLTIGGHVFSVTQAAPACGVGLSTTSVSLTSAPAFRTTQVTTSSGCAWTAVSSVPWIAITSGSSGTGMGAVSYSIAANTGTGSRTGTITVSGQTITVTQAGAACTFGLTPTSITVGPTASSGSVTVTSSGSCSWTASSNVAWLTVTSGSSGQGNGAVQYSVTPNGGTLSRTGTITVGGRSFTVTQSGSTCTITLSINGVSVGAPATSVPVNVLAGADCSWAATSSVPWITVAGGAAGTGGGTVTLAIAENTTTAVRTGGVSIGGRAFTVTQTGECDYTVSPTALTVSGSSAGGFVWVTAGAGCAWTAQSDASWVTLNSSGGQGGGVVGLTVAANTSTSARTATLTVAGTSVTVTQAGAACTLSVSPISMNVGGGTQNVAVTAPAGCAWTASTTTPWITFPSGAGGTGSGTLVVEFTPNSSIFARSGIINIGPWRIFVSQRVTLPPTAPTGLTIR